MNKLKVKFENVSKQYSLYSKQSDKLLELFLINRKKNNKSFYALNNISFEVNEGETIGVIGVNGSGKSTLSNLLAEIVPPSSGNVLINGQTSLIAISVGLNNGLTGLENIELKCLMQGLTKEQIKEITPDITNFADIGHFIEQPVKNYSSGMKSRLGFAISAYTDPDILVIDEALSVGDDTFYQKCLDKINEFKKNGKTIFFISHSLGQIKAISDKVLWLHYGQVKEYGNTDIILKNYNEFIKWYNTLNESDKKKYKLEQLKIQSKEIIDNKNYTRTKTERNNKNKPKSIVFITQISFLFLGILLSVYFMFAEEPAAIFKNLSSSQESKLIEVNKEVADQENNIDEETEKEESIKYTNQLGFITENNAALYYEMDSQYKIESLEFGSKVKVLEKTKDYYKISTNNKTGFINNMEITLVEKKVMDELELEDILYILPETFVNSYEYYLAFVGSEYNESEIFNSGTEFIDNEGRKMVSVDNITYLFNDEDVANVLIIDSINNSSSSIIPLEEHFLFSSEEEGLYYFEIKGYDVILDQKNNTIKLSSTKPL
ncbi:MULTISPECIES: ATP-binding cassette domain-containing protein [unclassified Sutcliffiella]|uniref:ATP-binding cassette domain-containing protein n=1 Tax=unclassified Sutcliffiella TaxID=2837532 RepID=UPI0030CFDFCF